MICKTPKETSITTQTLHIPPKNGRNATVAFWGKAPFLKVYTWSAGMVNQIPGNTKYAQERRILFNVQPKGGRGYPITSEVCPWEHTLAFPNFKMQEMGEAPSNHYAEMRRAMIFGQETTFTSSSFCPEATGKGKLHTASTSLYQPQ